MKIKTAQLSGAALDWAVEKCLGGTWRPYIKYSTDWAQGGRIIERERLCITPYDGYWTALFMDNLFEEDGSEFVMRGETPLIAAMRCFVSSRLGDKVDVPDELILAETDAAPVVKETT